MKYERKKTEHRKVTGKKPPKAGDSNRAPVVRLSEKDFPKLGDEPSAKRAADAPVKETKTQVKVSSQSA